MIVGIDASNLRQGGGLTHLIELLKAADPAARGIAKIIVWSGEATLARVADRPWLEKRSEPILDGGLSGRSAWQRKQLSTRAREAGCDVLFVPGGAFAGDFHPVVTMSRNMLPFEWREARRFGWSLMTAKVVALRLVQARTFRRADGIIFLTRYALGTITRKMKGIVAKSTIIPHGVDAQFRSPPREQLPIHRYSTNRPYRILYVSNIDVYKHQWHVASAVTTLRREGVPVALDLVGPAYPPALRRLARTLAAIDPAGECVGYAGGVPHGELRRRYAEADLCVFASSVENMPNILLEGMASGLPIACSNRGPMPEVLGDAGEYFDPERPAEIARALRKLIASPELRARLAKASFERSAAYSWTRCARETLDYLVKVAASSTGKES